LGHEVPFVGRARHYPEMVLRTRLAQVCAVALVLGVTFGAGVRSASFFADGPDNSVPKRIGNNVKHSKSLPAAVKQLRAEGIIVRPNVSESLDALLYWYDKRPDLQAVFSLTPGQPDLVKLLDYAAEIDDSTAVSLVPYRPGLSELRGRMGIIEGDGADITSTLFWLFANREDPQVDTDGTIAVLTNLWKARPEIHDQFVANGRLQLVPLIFWAANVPTDDPSYDLLVPITPELEQLPAEFPK
jgi:hypothetical protein